MKQFEIIRDGVTPNKALYQCLMQSVSDVPGAFAEFGVYKGDTFEVIMEIAKIQEREIHAFDSFTGMASPEKDGDDLYPEGTFNVFGADGFMEKFPDAIVHPGYVSGTLNFLVTQDIKLAFAHIDLDHHVPTRLALETVWTHILPGGVMACHDFRFGQVVRAAGAISGWMEKNRFKYEGLSDMTIWFRK